MITILLLLIYFFVLIRLLYVQSQLDPIKDSLFAGVSLSVSSLVFVPSIDFLVQMITNNGEIYFPLKTVSYAEMFLNKIDDGLDGSFLIIMVSSLILLIACRFVDRFILIQNVISRSPGDISRIHLLLLGLLSLIIFYPVLLTGSTSVLSESFYTRSADLPFSSQVSYLHLSSILLISALFHRANVIKTNISFCLPNVLTVFVFLIDAIVTGNRFVLFPLIIVSIIPVLRNSSFSMRKIMILLLICFLAILIIPLISLSVLYFRAISDQNTDWIGYIFDIANYSDNPLRLIYYQIFEVASPFVLLKVIAEAGIFEGLPISDNHLFYLPYDSLFTFLGRFLFSLSDPPTFSSALFQYTTGSSDSSFTCTFICEWMVKYGVALSLLITPIYVIFTAFTIKKLFNSAIAAPVVLIYMILMMRYSSSVLLTALITAFLLWQFAFQLSRVQFIQVKIR